MITKNIFSLIYIFGSFLSYIKETKTESSYNVDTSLSYILFSWRLLAKKNNSISSKQFADKIQDCSQNPSYSLFINLYDINYRYIINAKLIVDNPNLSFSGSIRNVILIDSSKVSYIRIENFNECSNNIDNWGYIETQHYGIYELNEFPGYSDNAEIGIKLDLKPVLQSIPYSNMIIKISNLHFLINPFNGNPIVEKNDNNIGFIDSFSLKFSGQIIGWSSWDIITISRFYSSENKINFKILTSISDYHINKKNVNCSLYILYNGNGTEMSDEIKIININVKNNDQGLILNNLTGDKKNFGIDAQINYYCGGYVGTNCEFKCEKKDEVTSCSEENGERYCLNGAFDVPTCSKIIKPCANIICQNNGSCIPHNNSYYCKCVKGFMGLNCEINTCLRDCHQGNCDKDGNCICRYPYEGKLCMNSRCSDNETRMCENEGICTKIKDIVMCICPSYAEGPTCSILKCNPKCMKGKCLHKRKSVIKTECVCDQKYTGIACDKIYIGDNIVISEIFLYLIILCILIFLITFKFMLGFLTRKIFYEDKYYYINTTFHRVQNNLTDNTLINAY